MTQLKSYPTKFDYVVYIATTVQDVWNALTDGDITPRYFFGRRVESDWTPGSPVAYWKENGKMDAHGTVLIWEPPQRLSFTFEAAQQTGAREQPSRVTFHLQPIGEIVKLTLTHDHLIPEDFEENPDTFKGINNGWPAILSNLKSVLETGQTLALGLRGK